MISILMPIYNGIEFIDESVGSILNQDYSKWELIIGINGHSPNSEVYQKAKSYENFENVRVIDFPDIQGKANTLNAMVAHCNYDHVAILDVDDIWHPNKLLSQSVYLNDYDVIGTMCVYFGDINSNGPNIPIGDISNFDFTQGNPIINSSAIIKKEYCQWNENGIEDYDLWLRLRKQNKRFYNIGNLFVKHRIHRKSAFNSKGHNTEVNELIKMYNS